MRLHTPALALILALLIGLQVRCKEEEETTDIGLVNKNPLKEGGGGGGDESGEGYVRVVWWWWWRRQGSINSRVSFRKQQGE